MRHETTCCCCWRHGLLHGARQQAQPKRTARTLARSCASRAARLQAACIACAFNQSTTSRVKAGRVLESWWRAPHLTRSAPHHHLAVARRRGSAGPPATRAPRRRRQTRRRTWRPPPLSAAAHAKRGLRFVFDERDNRWQWLQLWRHTHHGRAQNQAVRRHGAHGERTLHDGAAERLGEQEEAAQAVGLHAEPLRQLSHPVVAACRISLAAHAAHRAAHQSVALQVVRHDVKRARGGEREGEALESSRSATHGSKTVACESRAAALPAPHVRSPRPWPDCAARWPREAAARAVDKRRKRGSRGRHGASCARRCAAAVAPTMAQASGCRAVSRAMACTLIAGRTQRAERSSGDCTPSPAQRV